MTFPEGFPYTNFHELNMDWIIKIAKDFLDQYTNIQQTIQTGLDDLDEKAAALEAALDAWYTEHSAEIQSELTSALNAALTSFNTLADAKGREVIASIPADYTALSNAVTQLQADMLTALSASPGANLFNPNAAGILLNRYLNSSGGYQTSTSYLVSDYIPVTAGTTYYLDNLVNPSSAVYAAWYTSAKTLISAFSENPNQTGRYSVAAPSSAAFLRVSIDQRRRYTTAMVSTVANAEYVPYTDLTYTLLDLAATTYNPAVTYKTGEIVSHDGAFYRCVSDIAAAESWNANHWTLIRSLGDGLSMLSRGIRYGKNSITKSGTSVTAGASIAISNSSCNVSKNVIYQFCCTFPGTFVSQEVGYGAHSTKYASWVIIDPTYLTVYRSQGSGNNPITTQFTHGLTISDFLNVQIVTDSDAYTAKVKIQTLAGEYTTPTSSDFWGNCMGGYNAKPGQQLTDYTYTITWQDAVKPVWLFGDSYMAFSDDRWVWYLNDVGCFDNVLINAVGGLNSTNAALSFRPLQGEPNFALWALGMNDAADADNTTPAPAWLTAAEQFVAWCRERNCVPVFGTIPSIPTKLHEGKNYWIRNSGYRYVDFAKAVNASPAGVWYSGMISADETHPTVRGAIAMYHRALADFPEVAGGAI